MTTITRKSGLRIEIPEGFVLIEPIISSSKTRETQRHGPRTMPSTAEPLPPLIEALLDQDLQVLDSMVIDVTPEVATAVRKGRPIQRTLDISKKIGDEENAVLLIEQDGVYSWLLPTTVPDAKVSRSGGLGQGEVHFSITLGRPTEDVQEFKKRGFVSDFIVGKVRAYVLKFVVNWGTEKLMHYLERNVQKGLIHMNSDDPSEWSRFDKLDQLKLPTDKPVRILLFIHGTFSSTLGSYGALGGTDKGKQLLQTAQDHYDAVIGFDYPTLSLSPKENAQELLDVLQSYPWTVPPHLDIITFSQGGLVYRALAEILLPKETWCPSIDRVIFVAVPNAGTNLAEPDNWHTLLDLYTNLAATASKVLTKIPQFTIATKIFNELIQGLGALGKYLASQAVTKGDVPGLAAMEPDGPFITEINRAQAGQPTVDTTFYCAVTSEFEASLLNNAAVPKEFPERLVMTVVDRVADQLFGVANDLVIDTPSMTAIEQGAGKFIKDHFSFDKNSQVYHTVYFSQPAVARVLSRWLGLDKPNTNNSRSSSGDWVSPGNIVSPILPPEVETNVLITTSTETLDTLRNDLENSPESEFVIVQRPYEDQILNYAYRRNEVEELSQDWHGDTTVLDGLQMHEYQASETCSPISRMEPSERDMGGPTVGHIVILDNDQPVGVVPEPSLLPTIETEYFDFEKEALHEDSRDEVDSERLGEPMDSLHQWQPRASISRLVREEEEKFEQQSSKVQCHFYAEMPNAVKLGEDVSLLVSVSREFIQAAAGMMTTNDIVQIDLDSRIILDVRTRENFIVVGSARAEIEPPEPESPADIYFTVRSTDLDEGEVWVTARQGQVPLVTLKLRVKILEVQPETALPTSARASTDEQIMLPSTLCQLRIFERKNGEDISYEYDLDIPDVIFDRFESPTIRTDRGEYIKKLYKEIEQRWLSAQQDVDAFNQEMREMGGSLFGQLFPLKLQRALWDNRDAIGRIQVISTEPFIPWEIVHLTEPGQALPDESLFLAQLGVVRWLHGSYYPNEVRIRKDRAYYIIPDYPHPDDKLPGTVDEAEYLQQAFQATSVDPHPIPVRQVLRGPSNFDLLHFAGHGISEQDDIVNSQLQLEGRVENNTVIPEYLSSMAVEQQSRLQGADGNRPMVVLNACQTGRIGFRLTGMGGFASAFLSRGAGIFVSTLWSVSDQPAKDFVVKLYEELLGGADLADAVIAAREAARVAGDASWLCYVVYGHPNAHIITSN